MSFNSEQTPNTQYYRLNTGQWSPEFKMQKGK